MWLIKYFNPTWIFLLVHHLVISDNFTLFYRKREIIYRKCHSNLCAEDLSNNFCHTTKPAQNKRKNRRMSRIISFWSSTFSFKGNVSSEVKRKHFFRVESLTEGFLVFKFGNILISYIILEQSQFPNFFL